MNSILRLGSTIRVVTCKYLLLPPSWTSSDLCIHRTYYNKLHFLNILNRFIFSLNLIIYFSNFFIKFNMNIFVFFTFNIYVGADVTTSGMILWCTKERLALFNIVISCLKAPHTPETHNCWNHTIFYIKLLNRLT